MRLLFISLEYKSGTFSGNGIAAQSQVRSLTKLGHEVLVISGRPAEAEDLAANCEQGEVLHEVPLSRWGTLDRNSAWDEFAQKASTVSIAQKVTDFNPQAVLGVDWTSLPCYRALVAACQSLRVPLPYVYLNYRVYLRTAAAEDTEFFKNMEGDAVRTAALVFVLSIADADYFSTQFPDAIRASNRPQVLLPALRCDMAELPLPGDVADPEPQAGSSPACFGDRPYLLCCVRLSPEKEPLRFVDLVSRLQASGTLDRLKLTPFLFGAWRTEYSEMVKQRLKAVVPTSIISPHFLGPVDMAAIFGRARLNIHPPLYDAYGMTIVEAACQGTPSVVNGGGFVGATDLLSSNDGEVIALDFQKPTELLVQDIVAILEDVAGLHAVAQRAASKARSWTELDNGRTLAEAVEGILGG
eukprot:jgi/Botrbrau1/15737/Bobra.4_1s0105.1